MTRLLVVNPNTSRGMTDTIRTAAEVAARRIGVDVVTICAAHGPPSIEGRFDEIVSAYWSLNSVMEIVDDYDGVVVACYGPHPAIEGIREATDVPTMGIMEATVLHALPLCSRFGIVTTSPRWQPLIEDGLKSLGVERRCASVRSSHLAVLELESLPRAEVCARLAVEARAAVDEDGADIILLGCAGMAGLAEAVAGAVDVPVVEAVAAGVTQVGALARSGARTSKRNLYRRVTPRPDVDVPAGLARVYRPGAREESSSR